jgi:Cys-rich protein (TIGR01571 family)
MNPNKLSALNHDDPEIPVTAATELETELTATAVPLQVIPLGFVVDSKTRTVNVIAPSDLPEGFTFFVDEGHQSTCQVRVPPGGVRAGQRFAAEVVMEHPRGSHNIPYGKFRDGLCDCFLLGCCHPQCCLTLWCTGCALGQVLSRMKLSWLANERAMTEGSGMSTCKIFLFIEITYLVLVSVLNIIVNNVSNDGSRVGLSDLDEDQPGWVAALVVIRSVLNIAHWLLLLIVTMKLRSYVRAKYQIPEKSCRGCEDCCCAFWCLSCTICQVARHTADYRTYNGACCTDDGLVNGSPQVV